MMIEIDDRRLKQLYNLESCCKKMFTDSKYIPDIQRVVSVSELEMIRNILKPLSNRPTLDELIDAYTNGTGHLLHSDYGERCCKVGLAFVAVRILNDLIDECSRIDDADCDPLHKAIQWRDKYKEEISGDYND